MPECAFLNETLSAAAVETISIKDFFIKNKGYNIVKSQTEQ